MSANQDLPAFFARNGLTDQDVATCLYFVKEQYPCHAVQPLSYQGGCSWTVKVHPVLFESPGCTTIVQFRLQKHAVSIDMAAAAHRIYSPLAPFTRELGQVPVGEGLCIQALGMSCIDGERLSEIQPKTRHLDQLMMHHLQVLMGSVSTFFAMQWYAGKRFNPTLSGCTGRVGSSIVFRLGSLERHLPTPVLRQRARWTREQVEKGVLDPLPVVLTHGDMMPSNIVVEVETWQVKGYVDWAEAEQLPYALCLYGLDLLLGYMDDSAGKPRFIYYIQAEELRATFWAALEQQVPAMASEEVRHALAVACHIGIFLWHGFSWDDGKIDRVVNPIDDAGELAYLESHLGLESPLVRHDSVFSDSRSSNAAG